MTLKKVYMIVLSIEPVELTTKGGYPAVITGLTINDEYTFKGTVTSENAGELQVFWNKSGSCHNQSDSANLDTSSYEFKDFIQDYHYLVNTLNT